MARHARRYDSMEEYATLALRRQREGAGPYPGIYLPRHRTEVTTDACLSCNGSGIYPNPTGVYFTPTEWLGCPDCRGTGSEAVAVGAS